MQYERIYSVVESIFLWKYFSKTKKLAQLEIDTYICRIKIVKTTFLILLNLYDFYNASTSKKIKNVANRRLAEMIFICSNSNVPIYLFQRKNVNKFWLFWKNCKNHPFDVTTMPQVSLYNFIFRWANDSKSLTFRKFVKCVVVLIARKIYFGYFIFSHR